jgi:hypothetical protein
MRQAARSCLHENQEVAMSYRPIILLAVITVFGALSTLALLDVGYVGILKPHFASWGGAQVFVDLVILAVLACRWMTEDARARGTVSWPFVLITVVAGSFGPLLYLLARELRPAERRAADLRSSSPA